MAESRQDLVSTSDSLEFERFAGLISIALGIGGIAYAVAFIVLLRTAPVGADYLSNLFLMIGGLLSGAVFVALYNRLRETDRGFALWALLLGVGAGLASAAHGAFEVANLINPPEATLGDLPVLNDPRGFFTFGVAGLALFIVSSLMTRDAWFPPGLGRLGYLLAVLLTIIYLGRLIILNPRNPLLLGAALLAGLIVNPAWYVWLGMTFLRAGRVRERDAVETQ